MSGPSAKKSPGQSKDILESFGDPDAWKCLCSASGITEDGLKWRKFTKAMFVGTGCLVQVSTEMQNNNGQWDLAEAVTFVPGPTEPIPARDSKGKVTGYRLGVSR
ncbi:hypothetical protein COB52_04970 [Candidatus Kaiserbacteria bacterium]|nr:MAG: hypothetical protein COB52_04970 [Candidatus Kaiserbacteria bacterium]